MDDFLKKVIDAVADPLFVKDREHRIILANQRFLDLMGLREEEIIGRDDSEFVPPAERDVFWEKDEQAFTSEKPIENIEHLTAQSGYKFILNTRKSSFTDDDGRQFLVGTVRDMTNQTRLESRYLIDQQRLKMVKRAVRVGLFDWDLVNERVEWDETMFSIYDVEPASFRNSFGDWAACLEPSELKSHEPYIYGTLADPAADLLEFSFRIHTRTGEERFIAASGSILRNAEGKAERIVGMNYDITQQKRIEAQLEQTRQHLEEQVRLKTEDLRIAKEHAESASLIKSDFLATMSHELRTPLNSIIVLSRLMRDTADMAELREMQDMILSSSEVLLGLVSDILDFSKIEADQLILEKIGFDVLSITGKTISSLKPLAQGKQISLEMICKNSEPMPFVLGDPLRFRQILTNLVSNAVKYSTNGTVRVELEFKRKDENHIDLVTRVSDRGIGIPGDKLVAIFEKFKQVDNSTTRRYGGTGLGLAITKNLVDRMGGIIGVASEVGQGSTFTYTLPFEVTTQLTKDVENIDVLTASHDRTRVKVNDAHIVIAEDYPMNQVVIAKILEKMGAGRITTFANGRDVVEAFPTLEADLILMDCFMPELDGYEATRAIRAYEREHNVSRTPIVALTANAMVEDKERCLKAGMDDYTTKPINDLLLKTILRKYIVLDTAPLPAPMANVTIANDHPANGNNTAPPVQTRVNGGVANLESLEQLCQSDTALMRQIIESFNKQYSDYIGTMKKALAESNLKQWQLAAHTLKSGTGTMGATSLYAMCREAQQMETLEGDAARELLAALDNGLHLLEGELKDILKGLPVTAH